MEYSIKTRKRKKQYEREKVEVHREDKLKAGEKETPIIYQEADGIMIYAQGKDRKKQIERYQKEHPNEEVATGIEYRNMGAQKKSNI